MTDRPEPSPDQPKSTTTTNVSGGVNVEADNVNVGGDVVAHDKVTYVGMSPQAVQRLVITVGVLVVATAACFFVGGVVIGSRAIAALNRPVDSSPQGAADFQLGLDAIAALPPGQRSPRSFKEEELSSYIRFKLGPDIGLSNGRARILPDGQIVFYGRWSGFLSLPVMAISSVQTNSDQLFKVESAMVSINPFVDPTAVSGFGWVPLPSSVLQPLVDQIGSVIGQNFRVVSGGPAAPPDANQPTMTINVVRK
jgi:hypothetical protein